VRPRGFGLPTYYRIYIQIVAYYRAKGMVPPTTADSPAMGKKKE
jgi:hypothetical protein